MDYPHWGCGITDTRDHHVFRSARSLPLLSDYPPVEPLDRDLAVAAHAISTLFTARRRQPLAFRFPDGYFGVGGYHIVPCLGEPQPPSPDSRSEGATNSNTFLASSISQILNNPHRHLD